jgi:hypothetical protein
LLREIDDKGGQEEEVEDERGHESEDEERGITPTVIVKLRDKDFRTVHCGLRKSLLISGPGSIEEHCAKLLLYSLFRFILQLRSFFAG